MPLSGSVVDTICVLPVLIKQKNHPRYLVTLNSYNTVFVAKMDINNELSI